MSDDLNQIDRVRLFATQTREMLAARDVHIRRAREEGYSLRAIAEAAGMSYETVRRICES